MALTNGNSLIKTENFMFCARATRKEMVAIYVSSLQQGFVNFQIAKLPTDAILTKSFTVMDTSEETVFLHIQNHGPNTPMGNVFISDGSGKFYSLSIENVIRGTEYVDFEKVNSLDGVFLTNKFDMGHSHQLAFHGTANGGGSDKFNEMEQSENRMEKMQRNQKEDSNNLSSKQRRTRESVRKTGEEFDIKDLENNVRTQITHNKGGKWELIKAPQTDLAGKPRKCFLEEGCSLHLQIYSSNGLFPPPYSQESAIGIIIAVGNVGKDLQRHKIEQQSTFLSRDGGLNWAEVRKGSHIYEIGDHGGLIVMAPNIEATKEIFFTWNEGKSWHTLEISKTPIDVTNIIIEPNSVSQEFVVYGSQLDPETSESIGVVVTLDFKELHEPQCKGADRAGERDSDYELWTPFDGRHGDNKCYLGQQITYVRRKQDSECFNGEELERKIFKQYCACSEMDYECDSGFYKTEEGSCQRQENDDPDRIPKGGLSEEQVAQCDALGFYTVSQGYRKIPGNKCVGGVDLNPTVFSCSYSGWVMGFFRLKYVLFISIVGLAAYFGWSYIEAILIVLPIPDPKDLKERVSKLFTKEANVKKAQGYSSKFDAPISLEGEDDDDEEEDVGKPINKSGGKKDKLSYDSDEDKEDPENELISLDNEGGGDSRDRTGTAAERVPRLQKP